MTEEIRIERPKDHAGYFALWAKYALPSRPGGEMELVEEWGPEKFDRRQLRFKAFARELFKTDLYALMRFGLSHGDRFHKNVLDAKGNPMRWLDQPELFRRVRILDAASRNGELHKKWVYWERNGWKTSCMQALCIQRTLIKPDVRIAYYSRTEPMARKRAGGIRLEMENNPGLHLLFPEIFWVKPTIDVDPKWTPRDVGATVWGEGEFTVKRSAGDRAAQTMSEGTVTCYGIHTPGTGGHPNIIILDDCVDDTNSRSSAMIDKTTEFMAAAEKASDPSDAAMRQTWIVGTSYAKRDAYRESQEQGLITSVWHEPAVDFSKYGGKMTQREFDRRLVSGEIEGKILTNQELLGYRGKGDKAWRRFCLQYLCTVDMVQEKKDLDASLLSVYTVRPEVAGHNANIYICVDPAGYPGLSQPRELCDSAITVWGLCEDGQIRWLDGALDLLGAAARMRKVLNFHKKWRKVGSVIEARIEEGGTGGDVSCLCEIQQAENYTFQVVRISRGGGAGAINKTDRIHDRVGPLMEKLTLPQTMKRPRRDETHCLVQVLRQAVDDFPAGSDDQFNLLDSIVLLAEPVDKRVMVFRGGREPETRTLGPLKWPSRGAWRPRDTSPTMAEKYPKHAGKLALFSVSGIRAHTIRRPPKGRSVGL